MKLILENISKSFPGRRVFENISIEIKNGETLVVTGPNGSGKTTLLKIISSLLPQSSGKVIFQYNGKNISGKDILPHIGYAAPDLFLYDELTAIENLKFFAKVSGIRLPDLDAELVKFGLEGRGGDLVGSYSSGMKQRLKYILALIRKAPLLLLDEPTANLDEKGKMLADDIINKHDGITVIAANEENELKYADYTIRL
jgi:ABC-type multidrug transport system ATPase subunit